MKRYFVEDAKCEVVGAGMAASVVIGAVKYKCEDETGWLYLEEAQGFPMFYQTEEDIFEDLLKDNIDQEEFESYREDSIDELDGIELTDSYEEIFENIHTNMDSPAVPLLRYIITLVRCDMEDLKPIIALGKGNFIDEVEIPRSDEEEDFYEELFDEEEGEDDDEEDATGSDDTDVPETLVEIYNKRMMLEARLGAPNIEYDFDSDIRNKDINCLEKLRDACDSEENYLRFRKAYIDAELGKMDPTDYVKVSYLFAGIGQYETVMPKASLDGFKVWINSNGAAFLGDVQEANEEDRIAYILLNAWR